MTSEEKRKLLGEMLRAALDEVTNPGCPWVKWSDGFLGSDDEVNQFVAGKVDWAMTSARKLSGRINKTIESLVAEAL